MIKVRIESVRVSLMSQHRIAVLQEEDGDRYLPIWIGPFEAEAIAMHLRKESVPRPLTHDLMHTLIEELNGLDYVVIHDLDQDIYLARLIFNEGPGGGEYELECRPSDAIAIAVRCDCPIFVADKVMEVAAKVPDEEISLELHEDAMSTDVEGLKQTSENLEVFRDVVEGLDLDSLPDR